MTPLMKAVEHLDFEKVRSLLKEGVDINEDDDFGQRALHIAVDIEVQWALYETDKTRSIVKAHAEMTRLLLEHGADPLARDFRDASPLDWAVQSKHRLAEELLRQYIL